MEIEPSDCSRLFLVHCRNDSIPPFWVLAASFGEAVSKATKYGGDVRQIECLAQCYPGQKDVFKP